MKNTKTTNVKQANKIRGVVSKNGKQDSKIQSIEEYLDRMEKRVWILENPPYVEPEKDKWYWVKEGLVITVCATIGVILGFLIIGK